MSTPDLPALPSVVNRIVALWEVDLNVGGFLSYRLPLAVMRKKKLHYVIHTLAGDYIPLK